MTAATYTVHGITDEITTCDCCGKSKLARTVGLENEAGEVLYFGTTCAARAMKQSSKADLIVAKAKRLQRLRPVEQVVRAALPNGIAAAVKAGKAAAANIGKDVSVSGFESWGQVNIDANGARIVVSA